MKIWFLCLLIMLSMIPVGVLLRLIADKMVHGLRSWTKEGKYNMRLIWSENSFLGLLLCIEGIIENLSLLGVIVGIPLYFIFGI